METKIMNIPDALGLIVEAQGSLAPGPAKGAPITRRLATNEHVLLPASVDWAELDRVYGKPDKPLSDTEEPIHVHIFTKEPVKGYVKIDITSGRILGPDDDPDESVHVGLRSIRNWYRLIATTDPVWQRQGAARVPREYVDRMSSDTYRSMVIKVGVMYRPFINQHNTKSVANEKRYEPQLKKDGSILIIDRSHPMEDSNLFM